MSSFDRDGARLRLETWLARRMPGVSDIRVAPLTVPHGVGFSAETFFADVSYDLEGQRREESLVVRRQVESFSYFLDGDIGSLHATMAALQAYPDPPTPGVIGFEQSGDVLGAPFLVARRLPGRPIAQFPNYNVEGWLADLSPQNRNLVWSNGIKAMAAVHRLDPARNFSFLERPERGRPGIDQYLGGIETWYRWAVRDRPHPITDAALDYLLKERPAIDDMGLLWGDSIPSNLLIADDLSVSAVIDWEAAAMGPAEADLGWWLFFDHLFGEASGVQRAEGLPNAAETIAIYEQASGRKVRSIKYFELLAAFRMAIIVIRGADRLIAAGKLPAETLAGQVNPMTQLLARRLGLPEPEPTGDFLEMQLRGLDR